MVVIVKHRNCSEAVYSGTRMYDNGSFLKQYFTVGLIIIITVDEQLELLAYYVCKRNKNGSPGLFDKVCV